MRRPPRLLPAAALLSLPLLVATLCLWAASRTTARAVVFERFRAYGLTADGGLLYLSAATHVRSDAAGSSEIEDAAAPDGWRVRIVRGDGEGDGDDVPIDFLTRLSLHRGRGVNSLNSFGIARDVHGVVLPAAGVSFATDFSWSRRRTSAVVFPCWSAAAGFAVPPALWLLRRPWRAARARRRAARGQCPACSYDLRASPGRCPECGAPVPGSHGATAAAHPPLPSADMLPSAFVTTRASN